MLQNLNKQSTTERVVRVYTQHKSLKTIEKHKSTLARVRFTSPALLCPKAAEWRWQSPRLKSSSGSLDLPGSTRSLRVSVTLKTECEWKQSLPTVALVCLCSCPVQKRWMKEVFPTPELPRKTTLNTRWGLALVFCSSDTSIQRIIVSFFQLTAFVLRLNTLPTWVCACSVLSRPTLLEGWGLSVCSNSLDERSRLQKERTHTNQLLHHTNRIASLWWKTQTSSVARLVVCSYLWLSPASAKSLLESKNVHVKSEAE